MKEAPGCFPYRDAANVLGFSNIARKEAAAREV